MNFFISKNRLISISAILFLLGIWKLISYLVASDQIFPSPEQTLISFLNIIRTKHFLLSISATIIRGFTGFIIALFLAFLFGVPAGRSNSVFLFINPILVAIRSTPVISLILLAIIWLGG